MAEQECAEQQHFAKVCRAFQQYRQNATDIVQEKLQAAQGLKMVRDRLSSHFPLICHNAYFLNEIVEETTIFKKPEIELTEALKEQDYEKVLSTLRQFAREWSVDGLNERNCSFKPIIEKLEYLFADLEVAERGNIKVLVPGAGLGRLPFEIACKGFTCQGNEISIFMLMASELILNRVETANSIEIFPWIHSFSNVASAKTQTMPVLIPDVCAIDAVPPTALFSMSGGDFIEIYSKPSHHEAWDVVVTCFFLDTARNLVDYIKVIEKCLKPGGKWINLGPLLYHFEGNPHRESVEFTREELCLLVQDFGFKVNECDSVDSVYAASPNSLIHHVYHNIFFEATKDTANP